MKALLPVGIVLIVVGIVAGFGYQVIVTVTTGLPTGGIGWLQASGFVLAALGAIMIGAWIGRRRTARRNAEAHATDAQRPAAYTPRDRAPRDTPEDR